MLTRCTGQQCDPLMRQAIACVWQSDDRTNTLYGAPASTDDVLLLRAGGYWWDGDSWYRPNQVFDWARERYARRKAKNAVSLTAADLLDYTADPARATVGTVTDIDPGAGPVARWTDHLALWATSRPGDGLPLDQCVVNLSAPELGGDQLIGSAELAAMANIEPSTLRAYQARDEADLPDPQATISGRNVWSKPVAADWIEHRARSSGSVEATMAAADAAVDEFDNHLTRGQTDIRHRFTGTFFSWLAGTSPPTWTTSSPPRPWPPRSATR
jgi:hypothetical protein